MENKNTDSKDKTEISSALLSKPKAKLLNKEKKVIFDSMNEDSPKVIKKENEGKDEENATSLKEQHK
jgi:hypothetical protein